MRHIAIIPARGGSKRLPRKNILPFLGRPIIAYTIEAALSCGLFERVIVSTEDAEIAEIAASVGALLMDRSAELASDTARAADVCLDVLDCESAAGRDYDVLCCLFPTAPLRTGQDIAAVVRLVQPGLYDFAMAVSEFPYPAWQALTADGQGVLRPLWPELMNKQSQEFGTLLVDNGSTYAMSAQAFRRIRSLNGPNIRGHVMPRMRSVDIDVAEDLVMAQLFAERLGL